MGAWRRKPTKGKPGLAGLLGKVYFVSHLNVRCRLSIPIYLAVCSNIRFLWTPQFRVPSHVRGVCGVSSRMEL